MSQNLKILFLLCFLTFTVACSSSASEETGRRGSGRRGDGRGRGAPPSPVKVTVLEDQSRDVKHMLGETRVPREPRRVIAFGCADEMFFMGIDPVAQAGSWDFDSDGHYLNPYTDKIGHVGGVYGARIPNAESAMTFHPDLIIGGAGLTQNYRQFSQIASTIVLPDFPREDPMKKLLIIGRILGQTARAKRAAAWFNRKLELSREALKKAMGDKTCVGLLWPAGRQLRVSHPPFLYDVLGFSTPMEPTWIGKHVKGNDTFYMDPEQFVDYRPDYLFVVRMGRRRDFTPHEFEDFRVWSQVPAVASGRVWDVHVGHWISGGAMGYSKVLTELVNAIVPEDQISPELRSYLTDRPSAAILDSATEAGEEWYAKHPE